MPRAWRSALPAAQLYAAAGLLAVAVGLVFSSMAWTRRAERELERVDDALLRLQSMSASVHRYAELKLERSPAAEDGRREVLTELAELQRMVSLRPAWRDWVADLEPLVRRRLSVSSGERLGREIDRRLDALQEDELELQMVKRRQARARHLASAGIFGVTAALSLALLAAAFRSLRAEIAARRETAEKFSKAFHGCLTPMALGRLDTWEFVEVNRSLERLAGRPEGGLAGRSIDELDVRLGGEPLSAALGRLAEKGPLVDVRAELRRGTGESRRVLLSADTLTIQGQPCWFVCFYDVTERERAESALRDFSGALIRAEQKERRRLAQILHDNLQQTLAAAAMHLNLILDRRPQPAVQASAAAAAGILKEAVQTTRELSYELCPPAIARGSLGRALKWLGGRMQLRHNLEVLVIVEGETDELPESVRDFLFAAVRELLFNVVKHARPSGARVSVASSGGRLRVEVCDDGPAAGAARPQPGSGGLGLADIRERIALFGGWMETHGLDGTGARVVLDVPLSQA